ncbi:MULTISPECIES: hypothetical protein [unclassified Paenibacillus]|uniref:hypothetical protein n=1 Tax=unclassified Paenibacillus TaxID=185978 RepID=UPI0024064ED9|nr:MULTISPECIES: hypothetical protein [unclassified Paenibacillus]
MEQLRRKVMNLPKWPVSKPTVAVAIIIKSVFNIMPSEYCITSTEEVSSGLALLMATAILLGIVFMFSGPFYMKDINMHRAELRKPKAGKSRSWSIAGKSER